MAVEKDISTAELRREYIHAHGLALHVLGRLGADLHAAHGSDFPKHLKKLQDIDWRRENSAVWEGRAMHGGKISKSHLSVLLTTNYLKKRFGLPLSPEEDAEESKFLLED